MTALLLRVTHTHTDTEPLGDSLAYSHCVCLSNGTWYPPASGNQIKWATSVEASSSSFFLIHHSLGIINFIISVIIIVKLFFIFLLFSPLPIPLPAQNIKCMLMCFGDCQHTEMARGREEWEWEERVGEGVETARRAGDQWGWEAGGERVCVCVCWGGAQVGRGACCEGEHYVFCWRIWNPINQAEERRDAERMRSPFTLMRPGRGKRSATWASNNHADTEELWQYLHFSFSPSLSFLSPLFCVNITVSFTLSTCSPERYLPATLFSRHRAKTIFCLKSLHIKQELKANYQVGLQLLINSLAKAMLIREAQQFCFTPCISLAHQIQQNCGSCWQELCWNWNQTIRRP